MKSIGLAFYSDISWILFALILFFSSFFIILILSAGTTSKEKARRAAQLPFEGESHEPK